MSVGKEISLLVNQTGIDASKAQQILDVFVPMSEAIDKFENAYNGIVEDVEENGMCENYTKQAKTLRLQISKIRIEVERARKTEKEFYLRGGKAVDGIANIFKNAVFEKENNLKQIEDYYIILEKKRIIKLQEDRLSMIGEYVEDTE